MKRTTILKRFRSKEAKEFEGQEGVEVQRDTKEDHEEQQGTLCDLEV